MGDADALLRAGRIDAFKHLRIDGSFIVREEEFQVARRRACFRFREPVNQFVYLLLGLHRPNYTPAPLRPCGHFGLILRKPSLDHPGHG